MRKIAKALMVLALLASAAMPLTALEKSSSAYVHDFSLFSVAVLFVGERGSVEACGCLSSDQLDRFFQNWDRPSPYYQKVLDEGRYFIIAKADAGQAADAFFLDIQSYLGQPKDLEVLPVAQIQVFDHDFDEFSLTVYFVGKEGRIEMCNCMGLELFEDFLAFSSSQRPSYQRVYDNGDYFLLALSDPFAAVQDFFLDVQDYLDGLEAGTADLVLL